MGFGVAILSSDTIKMFGGADWSSTDNGSHLLEVPKTVPKLTFVREIKPSEASVI
jgi:hypothetical protein